VPYAPYINNGITLGVDQEPVGHEGTETFTDVPGIKNIVPPNEQVDDVEVTNYASDGKEFLPGMYDGGEVTVEVEYDPADAVHGFLRGLPAARTVHKWQITLPSGKTITWAGYAKQWNPNCNRRGEAVTSSVVVKVTGVPVYATIS